MQGRNTSNLYLYEQTYYSKACWGLTKRITNTICRLYLCNLIFQIIVLHLRISHFLPIRHTEEVSLSLLYHLEFQCDGETGGTRSPLWYPSSLGYQSSAKRFCSNKIVPACWASAARTVWPSQTVTTSRCLWQTDWRATQTGSNDSSGSDISCHCYNKLALKQYGDNL